MFASANASAPPPTHTAASLFVSEFYVCLTTLSVILKRLASNGRTMMYSESGRA